MEKIIEIIENHAIWTLIKDSQRLMLTMPEVRIWLGKNYFE